MLELISTFWNLVAINKNGHASKFLYLFVFHRKISKNHGSWGWTLWTRPECQAHSKFDIGRSCQSHRIYIYIHITIIKCRKHDMSSATLCNKCVFCGHFGVAGIVLPAAVPSLERCWARQGGLGMFSPRCAARPKQCKTAIPMTEMMEEWFHPEDFILMTYDSYVSPVFSLLSCLIMFYNFISRCVCRDQGRFPRPLPHSSWSGFSIQPTQCA